jgi:hypothetical protein
MTSPRLACFLLLLACGPSSPADAARKPRFGDFMGINGHYHFRPELYRPVAALVRNYHPMTWDLPGNTADPTVFPQTRQRVDGKLVEWDRVYGAWKAAGFRIDASIQFEFVKPDAWTNLPRDAEAYGRAFAQKLGPSSPLALIEAAEIGNEPAAYSSELYRTVFEAMARGLRAGDPRLKIVTAAVAAQTPDEYSKPIESLRGLENYYDVLNIHTYSMIEGWPTWRRVHPEHPGIPYLRVITELAAWRDAHAPDKEIWVTEFGYDASTKPAPAAGDFSKWISSTETEQAQWLVRSFLLFAAMPVERAYVYYYNDSDEAMFHASSGITRNFVPKPAYWALAHLRHTLGDFRFNRIVSAKADDIYVYEFVHADDGARRLWAVWSPTGSQRSAPQTLELPGRPVRAEVMPLADGPVQTVELGTNDKTVTLNVSETPVFIEMQ